jgi:glycosyltransferase involved in cell wall biosynthesis
MDRILVHSSNQLEVVRRDLGVPTSLLHVVAYGVDTAFWCPQGLPEEDLIVSAGREHRDYETLVQACSDMARLFITDGSAHSPKARRQAPTAWPASVERRGVGYGELRRLYGRASVVVVPVMPADYPFGITAVLEAMSMGKAVVVSGTEGLRGVVQDGQTGLVVPPGDVPTLRQAVSQLLAHPADRRRLGEAARRVAIEQYGLDRYVGELGRHLLEVAEHTSSSRVPAHGESRDGR